MNHASHLPLSGENASELVRLVGIHFPYKQTQTSNLAQRTSLPPCEPTLNDYVSSNNIVVHCTQNGLSFPFALLCVALHRIKLHSLYCIALHCIASIACLFLISN